MSLSILCALKDIYVFVNHVVSELKNKFKPDNLISRLISDGFYVKECLISANSASILRAEIDKRLNGDALVWRSDDRSDSRIYGFESLFDLSTAGLEVDSLRKIGESYLGRTLRYVIVVAGRLDAVEGNLGSGGGWHRDSPFRHQFKVIVYLSDVDSADGPFQYIMKSHKPIEKIRFSGLGSDITRFSESSVEGVLSEKLCELRGSAGDAIFVDTKGIHRGKPIEQGRRYALTFYFFEASPSKHIDQLTQCGASKL